MDWGEPGLRCTLTALDGAGVRYAGAGLTAAEAGAACFVDVAGCTLAFLSWACTVPPGFRASAHQAGLAGVSVRTSYAPMGNWQDFLDVTRLVFAGKLVPQVFAVYPLEAIAEAEDALDRREHFGKIVVHVTGQPA